MVWSCPLYHVYAKWLDFSSASSPLYLLKNVQESAKWPLRKLMLLYKKYSKKVGDLKKRKYQQFTPEQRAKTGKYAAENSNTSAVKRFSGEFEAPGESTVRYFRKEQDAFRGITTIGAGRAVAPPPAFPAMVKNWKLKAE